MPFSTPIVYQVMRSGSGWVVRVQPRGVGSYHSSFAEAERMARLRAERDRAELIIDDPASVLLAS